jgi:hypothetical protein
MPASSAALLMPFKRDGSEVWSFECDNGHIIADMAELAVRFRLSRMSLSRHAMFGRIFGLDGREAYRELRLVAL